MNSGHWVDRLRHEKGSNVLYADEHADCRTGDSIYLIENWDDQLYTASDRVVPTLCWSQ